MATQVDGFINASDILRSGVYALVHRGQIVYIGKAKRMLNRVQAHLSVWAAKRKERIPAWIPVKGIYYDEVLICPVHPDRLDEVEAQMIDRYRPKYNVQLKSPGPIEAPFSITVRGKVLQFNQPRVAAPDPNFRRRA